MSKSTQKFIHERVRLSLKSTIHAETAGLWQAKAYDMLWSAGHDRINSARFVFLDYIFILAKSECHPISNLILKRKGGEEKLRITTAFIYSQFKSSSRHWPRNEYIE